MPRKKRKAVGQMNENLIEVQNLKQYFPISMGWFQTKPLKAVDGVSFQIRRGETLGLVGESGCGKTTVGRTLLHLYPPTSGQIIFDGKVIKTREDIRQYRKKAAMVFQDPYSSLNPRMTVADLIAEPLDIHRLYENRNHRREKVLELMAKVGLNAEHAGRNLWCATSRFRRWMFLFRLRLSICLRICRRRWD